MRKKPPAAKNKSRNSISGKFKGISQEVADYAKQWPADIIVLGTHGRTGLNRLLLGSVAEKLVRLSTVPVLLIPG